MIMIREPDGTIRVTGPAEADAMIDVLRILIDASPAAVAGMSEQTGVPEADVIRLADRRGRA
jgi:hypothetical protein